MSSSPLSERRCSFCNKEQKQVERLIAGPGEVYICDQCVALCYDILREEKTGGFHGPPQKINPAKTLAAARHNLLAHELFLRDLGAHVADKPGRHLWEILRPMNWRVGPTGPRVLELLGVPFLDAWGANRTAVTQMLRSLGQTEFANAYAAYYIKGWDHFLSDGEDTEAARQAVLAGALALARGIIIAKESR